MANLEKFNEIVAKYSSLADFLLVYISEAHPTDLDDWTYEENPFQIQQPTSVKERMEAAKHIFNYEALSCPVVIDDVSDEITRSYGAFPERLFIVFDGKIAYQGGAGPFHYKLDDVVSWLENYKEQ